MERDGMNMILTSMIDYETKKQSRSAGRRQVSRLIRRGRSAAKADGRLVNPRAVATSRGCPVMMFAPLLQMAETANLSVLAYMLEHHPDSVRGSQKLKDHFRHLDDFFAFIHDLCGIPRLAPEDFPEDVAAFLKLKARHKGS